MDVVYTIESLGSEKSSGKWMSIFNNIIILIFFVILRQSEL